MRSLDAQNTQTTAISESSRVSGPTDDVDNLVDVVTHLDQIEVGRVYLAVGKHRRAQPVDQAGPVRRVVEHDRKGRDLAGLHQRQRLEQLVHRAEATRQNDERLRVLDEHRFTREEVAEVET